MIGILNSQNVINLNKRFDINIMSISGNDEDISIEFTKQCDFTNISCKTTFNIPYVVKCFPNMSIDKIIEEVIENTLDKMGR